MRASKNTETFFGTSRSLCEPNKPMNAFSGLQNGFPGVSHMVAEGGGQGSHLAPPALNNSLF